MGIEIKKGSLINGRYEIVQLVGRGGMADVYKAKCNKLNRFVAIKFLKEEFLADREFLARFDAEAKASAGLTHPNIVSVYDVGEVEARKYIVMEFVEGITLKAYVERNGKLTWREATSVAGQICSALACAHRGGIIHRDIKPQNIVLTKSGVAKVMDFGIARAVSQSTIVKSDRSILGSAHYFSPEQGVGGSVDKTTDLYSLGVVLFEMLTGRVPFDNDNPISLALMHSNSPVPAIGAFASDVPEGLQAVVYKAMGKSRDERYQSAEEMLSDLKSVIKGSEIKYAYGGGALRGELSEQDSEEDEKNTKLVSVLAAVVIVVVIAVIATLSIIFASSWGKDKDDGGGREDNKPPVVSAMPTPTEDDESAQVPDVLNYKEESAIEALEEAGYKVKVEEKDTEDSSKVGKVIEQKPGEGAALPKDSEVTIYIGIEKEDEEIEVPRVVGRSEEDAVSSLEDAGFKVTVKEEETDDKSKVGDVTEQKPVAGQKLKEGSTVEITVGKAAKETEITVLKVVGESKDEAVRMLEDEGFKVVVAEKEVESKADIGVVIEQKPSGGEKLKEGGSVTITVGKEAKEKEEVVSITVPDVDAEEIWVEVKVDGVAVMKQTYEPGQSANCIVKLEPGDRKKVEFYVNGELEASKEVSY